MDFEDFSNTPDDSPPSREDNGISIHGGFPNPATDTTLRPLDLNSLLIKNRASTYFMRIRGNDWQALGIFDGDIAIIDRAPKARRNDLVVWWEADSFRLSPRHAVPPGSPTWGLVTATIHQYRPLSS